MALGEPAPPHWSQLGLCQEPRYQRYFFPEKENDPGIPFSKQICSRCPVLQECRRFAWETKQQWGTWGGITEWERRKALNFVGSLRPDQSTEAPTTTTDFLDSDEGFVFHITLTGVASPDLDDPPIEPVLDFHIDL